MSLLAEDERVSPVFGELRGQDRDDELMRDVMSLRYLQARIAIKIANVAENGSYREDGHRSVRAWYEAVTNSSHEDALADVGVALGLWELPDTAGALFDGLIGMSQVREIVKVFRNPECRKHREIGEQVLALEAGRLRYPAFCEVVEHFRHVTDPDGVRRAHERAVQGRNASEMIVGAEFVARAHGGVLAGAAMKEIFEQFVYAEYLADLDELHERCGEDAPASQMRAPRPSAASTPCVESTSSRPMPAVPTTTRNPPRPRSKTQSTTTRRRRTRPGTPTRLTMSTTLTLRPGQRSRPRLAVRSRPPPAARRRPAGWVGERIARPGRCGPWSTSSPTRRPTPTRCASWPPGRTRPFRRLARS
jgi:hypothetical protein